jgi:hypothetical protein
MNKKNQNSIIKHCFITFAILLLIIPLNLSAKKQKKGANLIILKDDGQVIEGELLSVKDRSLLLMICGSNAEAIVDISNVQEISMKRKKNFWNGFLKGGWIGLAGGTVLGLCCCSHEPEGLRYKGCVILGGIMMGVYGGLGGGIVNVTARKYKKVHIIGKTSDEIDRFLKQLKEMARFKD